MNRKAKPTAVSEVLNSILTRKEINSAKNLEFLSSWDEVVGSSMARVSKPSELKKGILNVKVIDAAWAQELSFQESNIIEKLCQMGYGGVVSKIKFIVGSPLDFK